MGRRESLLQRNLGEVKGVCPSLLHPPQVAQAPLKLRSQPRKRIWWPPNSLLGGSYSQRQPCTLGARRGHFNLRQQQQSSSWWSCQASSKRQRARRSQCLARWVGYQHLPDGGRSLCTFCVWGGQWTGLGPPWLPLHQPSACFSPAPVLFLISVLKGSLLPTTPHCPSSTFPSPRIIPSWSTGQTNFQNHFLHDAV